MHIFVNALGILMLCEKVVTGWGLICLLIFLLDADCWLWGYTQPLQRFSSHLVTCLLFSGSKLNLRLTRFHFSVPSSVFLVVYVRPLSSPFPPPSCGLGISLVGVKLLLGLYSKTSFFHSQLSWHIVMEGYSRLREFLM